eukprot:363169-Chlamydomonas_euryale.AAC.13
MVMRSDACPHLPCSTAAYPELGLALTVLNTRCFMIRHGATLSGNQHAADLVVLLAAVGDPTGCRTSVHSDFATVSGSRLPAYAFQRWQSSSSALMIPIIQW